MSDSTGAPAGYLLTPGPLTTSRAVRQAMDADWGSRDPAFIALTADVRRRLVDVVAGGEAFECVPLQGSGTFAIEAMLGTLAPGDATTLVLVNGAYGQRMVSILQRIGRPVAMLEFDEVERIAPERVAAELDSKPQISHVAVVHCETTTGIENDLAAIAAVVAGHGRRLLVDAMSSLGALPLDAPALRCDAIAASSNKCLQGAPGIGFVICARAALAGAAGRCHSVSLDLHAQNEGFEANGQWRFTPPTQVLAALAEALAELEREGGVSARRDRYRANAEVLIDGLTALGFELLLERQWQAPIIVTFRAPAAAGWDFERFYRALQGRGFTIYPGKLSRIDSFRVGCIGALDGAVMARFVAACRAVVTDLGLRLR